jgi:hypothetical protein
MAEYTPLQSSSRRRREEAREVPDNNLLSAWKRERGPAAVWKYPKTWALLAGIAVQVLFGIFATFFAFFALLLADGKRCPVALGASKPGPLIACLVGFGVGMWICEVYHPLYEQHERGPGGRMESWTLWGVVALGLNPHQINPGEGKL